MYVDKAEFSKRAVDWRTVTNNYRLREAKEILRLSIGHISDVENGNAEITARVFMAYHMAAPELFPMELASQFDLGDVEGLASENKGPENDGHERTESMQNDENPKPVDPAAPEPSADKGAPEKAADEGKPAPEGDPKEGEAEPAKEKTE